MLVCSGAPPESKQGAWGKLHIVSGLMQQLKEEVNKEMEATRDTGKLITVYTKREAWSKRAAPEWRSAFLANQKM